MTIKLLQWNISFQEKVKNIHRLIRDISPDIITLQEVASDTESNKGIHVAEELNERLGWNYVFVPEIVPSFPGKEVGNMIISKYPITDHESIDLIQGEPTEAVSTKVYLEATIDLEGLELHVGTTHITYDAKYHPTEQRTMEEEKLREILKQKESNYIFTGDLNNKPSSIFITELSKQFKNAGPAFEYNTANTKNENWKHRDPSHRIDYVFTTNEIAVRKAKTVATEFSDHLPILVDLDF